MKYDQLQLKNQEYENEISSLEREIKHEIKSYEIDWKSIQTMIDQILEIKEQQGIFLDLYEEY